MLSRGSTLPTPVSFLLPFIFAVAMFSLGRYFIRKPEGPNKFFTLGMIPPTKFGLLWARWTGYLFCTVSVGFAVLTVVYFAILTIQAVQSR
jgi:hypothetical protein